MCQPGIERLHDRANEFGCIPADIFGQVDGTDDGAAQHGGVACHELGDAEQDDVGAKFHRALEGGGSGGVVHHQRQAA